MPHPTRKDRQAIKKAQRRNRAHAAGAVVGVDAGKFRHCLVVRMKGGMDSRPFTFPVTRDGFEEAEAYILNHAGGIVPEDILVGIEFAGIYGQTLAHALHARGFKIVSVPPAYTKAAKKISHGKRLKTDEKDAESITALVGDGHFQEFPFLKSVYTGLRQLVSARERLTKLRGGAVTRLKSTLQITWPEFEAIFDDLEAKTAVAVLRTFPGPAEFLAARKATVLRVLQKTSRGQLGEDTYHQLRDGATRSVALPGSLTALKSEVDLLLKQIAFYTEQIKALEAAMKEAMEPLPEAQAVLSIPGVAPVSAAIFLGSIGDPKRINPPDRSWRSPGLPWWRTRAVPVWERCGSRKRDGLSCGASRSCWGSPRSGRTGSTARNSRGWSPVWVERRSPPSSPSDASFCG